MATTITVAIEKGGCGKTTMLRQAIGRMAKENLSRTAYIKARRTDNMAMMNRDLKKFFDEHGAAYPVWQALEAEAGRYLR